MDAEEALVAEAIAALCAANGQGLIGGCRRIRDGDENALKEGERLHLRGAALRVSQASGAVRIVARALAARLDVSEAIFSRAAGNAPEWPPGLIGSMAHDASFAVAIAARKGPLRSVGIDIEDPGPLPAELVEIIATSRERQELRRGAFPARLLFCVKEAVYKATNPVDGFFLEPQDVHYDHNSGIAHTRTGHTLRIATDQRSHYLALACL